MARSNKKNKETKEALGIFLEKYKNKEGVNSILVFGSYLKEMDKNSDIDVYIVLDNSMTRERGNIWVHGVEIDYFVNPIKQVRKYLHDEIKNNRFSTADILTNSTVLYKKDNKIDNLIGLAKKNLQQKRTLNKEEKELAKYQIDDLIKDLEDVYIKKDNFIFNYIFYRLLENVTQVIFDLNRVPMPKVKAFGQVLEEIDPKAKDLIKNAWEKKSMEDRIRASKKLVNYTEKKLGGKREKNWSISSKCTI